MRDSVERFQEIIGDGNHRSLHVVCHPFNWVAGGRDMREVLAATWKRVLHGREQEIRLNRSYAEAMPSRMPESVLEGCSGQWVQAAWKGST